MRRYTLDGDECAWAMGNMTRETDRYERGTRIEDCGFGVFQFRGGAHAAGELTVDDGATGASMYPFCTCWQRVL